MEELNRFERFFHNKNVIRAIFIFPLISSVFIAIALKNFVNIHQSLAYLIGLNRLFTLILAIMFINMLANFSALVLYYCLYNRIEYIKKRNNKKAS